MIELIFCKKLVDQNYKAMYLSKIIWFEGINSCETKKSL